ncbi:MAG: hypothetical protein R3D56_03990 [Paracoccaceae bacterium]
MMAYVEMFGRDVGRFRKCADPDERKPPRRRSARGHRLPHPTGT